MAPYAAAGWQGVHMIWLVLAAVFAFLAIHPFVTYPLSLLAAVRLYRKPTVTTEAGHPSVAIVVCAYNEEAVIDEKLRNCLAVRNGDPATAIFVYTDGCSDRTVEIVRAHGDQIHLVEGRARRGKSAGMNQLVDRARAWGAEILFFTDANVILDAGSLAAMRRTFTDPEIGCVTGHLDYVNETESPTALVGSRYWSLDEAIKQLETDSGSCIGADGAIFGIRTKLFRTVPENIIDDFFTSMSVLCDGWRSVYSRELVARERSATVLKEEYRRKVRIACRAFNCHRLLWPRVLRMSPWTIYKYVSHKLARWLMAFWVAGFAVSVVAALLTLQASWSMKFGLIAATALLAAMVTLLPGKPWSYIREAFVAIFATGVGVVKSLQGERFQTWSQAGSTRQVQAEPTIER
jgi:cellulose synthase/poly-beta-1,6-N-acetylglucosamine synthase-like glycosyltransferase